MQSSTYRQIILPFRNHKHGLIIDGVKPSFIKQSNMYSLAWRMPYKFCFSLIQYDLSAIPVFWVRALPSLRNAHIYDVLQWLVPSETCFIKRVAELRDSPKSLKFFKN
jgi:hypothetical protein